jgi:hypothetical protein
VKNVLKIVRTAQRREATIRDRQRRLKPLIGDKIFWEDLP